MLFLREACLLPQTVTTQTTRNHPLTTSPVVISGYPQKSREPKPRYDLKRVTSMGHCLKKRIVPHPRTNIWQSMSQNEATEMRNLAKERKSSHKVVRLHRVIRTPFLTIMKE